MTVLRVFIVTDMEDEEHGGRPPPGCLEPRLGEFDEEVAQQFDAIFRAAERHGVYVVLVAFALGFSEDDPWKSWDDNPYAAVRGGPAKTRYDFFSNPEAKRWAANRLRYLARRYGGSTHLMAIDLLNEPEWDGAIPEVLWIPWAEEMARIWRKADPSGHLVTAGSVGLHWNIEGDERAWYASSENDLVQWHLYGKETYEVHALSQELNRRVRETWQYGKPVLIGEFAWGGEPKPAYDHTHVGIWTAIFSGAWPLAHSAPPFNVDSDELMTPERARHFRALRRFLASLPPMDPEPPVVRDGVTVYALRGEEVAALWLLAAEDRYGEQIAGVRVDLGNLRPGCWRITWIDDLTGQPLTTAEAEVHGAQTLIDAPPFARHLAAKLTRCGDTTVR